MNIIKSLLAMSMAISVCIAQEINISGTVTDTGGTPIAGAVVSLEKANMATATSSDGRFSIVGIVSINDQINQTIPHKLFATIKNGLLYINIQEKSIVEITTYTLQGKIISAINKTMDAGTHSIALSRVGSGVYFYKVKTGGSEFVIKSNSIGGVSTGTSVSVQGSSTMALARHSMSYESINDIIAVTKAGYLNYRVIVTNSDTSGIEIKMIICADSVTDADGNIYQAVQIGNQVWMAENLRTTKYNDGTDIPYITDNIEWETYTNGAYCYYEDTSDIEFIEKFGALYNWYAIKTKKLAPTGWRVPDTSDWNELEEYLINNGYGYEGSGQDIAKSLAAKTDWDTLIQIEGTPAHDKASNNSSGFSALPGSRYSYGSYYIIGRFGVWWSATDDSLNATYAYGRELYYDHPFFTKLNTGKNVGHSVRLVMN